MNEINWNKRKYTKDEFISAWKNSNNIRDCLLRLGIEAKGGNYPVIRSTAKILGLTDKHFNRRTNKTTYNKVRPLKKYLNNEYPIGSNLLKKKLLKKGLLENVCSECGLENKWEGETITLELDHIDGNNKNNNLSNLRILCPNCHAQTDTYTGKNIKIPKKIVENHCIDCGTEIVRKSKRCNQCNNKVPTSKETRKKISESLLKYNNSNIPTKEELEVKILEEPTNLTKLANFYNVSHPTITKYIKKYKLDELLKDNYLSYVNCENCGRKLSLNTAGKHNCNSKSNIRWMKHQAKLNKR